MPSLNCVILEPESGIVHSSVIWLHGLGADGHDFVPIVETLGLKHTRFILPHAPSRPVSMNGNYVMPAWYDIYGLGSNMQDEQGISETQGKIEELIAMEVAKGIGPDHIVLAGFSQGGAVALHTALRYPQKLAGVIALSTYLPVKDKLKQEAHIANANTAIFMAHGKFDGVITLARATVSAEHLTQLEYPLEWHEYAMAHSVCNDEIADILSFLTTICKAT